MKICVADDEKEVRESIIHKLRNLFPAAGVFDVEFGRVALDKIVAVQPDLVFIDIRMPELDGLEILQALKRQLPTIQVVILSGYEDFEYARRALQLGAVDYLLKPADRDELRGVVEQIKAKQDTTFRKELEICLGQLSGRYVFVHDIRCGDASLWFDERQAKEIRFGELESLQKCGAQAFPTETWLIAFSLNSDYGGVVTLAQAGAQGAIFREKTEFVPVLMAAMEKWESRRFLGDDGARTGRAGGNPKQTAKRAAALRQRMLSAAKDGDYPALESALSDWLQVLEELEFIQLRKECVHLMALLDEGLIKQDIIVLEEEKIHYWTQWIVKHKTWTHLQERIRKFVLGGIRAWIELEHQPHTNISWFEHALQLVDSSHDPNLSLESVAEAVGVHPVTLSRIFKQQTGLNFVRYMVRSRLRHSQTLLLKTDKNINTISEEIGYVDHRYFRSLFKKEFGLTPSEYRGRNGVAAPHDETEYTR